MGEAILEYWPLSQEVAEALAGHPEVLVRLCSRACRWEGVEIFSVVEEESFSVNLDCLAVLTRCQSIQRHLRPFFDVWLVVLITDPRSLRSERETCALALSVSQIPLPLLLHWPNMNHVEANLAVSCYLHHNPSLSW